MYFIEDGKIFIQEGNEYLNVGIEAKDKVKVIRELESVTVVPGTVKKKSIKNAVPYTLDELVKKFAISEDNPIPVIEKTTKGK